MAPPPYPPSIAITYAGLAFFIPPGGQSDSQYAGANMANGASSVTLTGQPDSTRGLKFSLVDANSSITAGIFSVTYLDQWGASHTETHSIANAGSHSWTTTYTAASIVSGGFTGVVGASVIDDSFSLGDTNTFQLPAPQGASSFAVVRVTYGVGFGGSKNTLDSAPTVDATLGTFIPNTAPNGSYYYQVDYTYSR